MAMMIRWSYKPDSTSRYVNDEKHSHPHPALRREKRFFVCLCVCVCVCLLYLLQYSCFSHRFTNFSRQVTNLDRSNFHLEHLGASNWNDENAHGSIYGMSTQHLPYGMMKHKTAEATNTFEVSDSRSKIQPGI